MTCSDCVYFSATDWRTYIDPLFDDINDDITSAQKIVHFCTRCKRYIYPEAHICEDFLPREDQTAKRDEGKLQISLVPTQIIRDIAEVRMYGNKKYGDPDNWRTVEKKRYVDALMRHLLAYIDDPDGVDEESGIPHYKHAACNMAFICEMEKNRTQPTEK